MDHLFTELTGEEELVVMVTDRTAEGVNCVEMSTAGGVSLTQQMAALAGSDIEVEEEEEPECGKSSICTSQ